MRSSVPFAIILATVLAGCTFNDKAPTPILTEKPKLILPEVQPVTQLPVEWMIITPKNYETKLKQLESKEGSLVAFALSPRGYEQLSMNVAELRRYIVQQNAVIAAYKKYYQENN